MSAMPRSAAMFPGQGSQFVGMARELHEGHASVRELYARAEAALGVDLAELSFRGPEEELRATRNTQPAIFLHSLAVLGLLQARGFAADAAAGHSLGEYTALVAAGVLEFEDGLRLVRRRGELMQEAGTARPGTMAAVLGLEEEAVTRLCREATAAAGGGVVVPANLNTAQQIVVSGDVAAVERAMELALAAGARRAQRLEVSGAFHSPLMQPAAEGLAAALREVPMRRGRFPVVCNVDGRGRREPDEIRDALLRQLTSPVRWVDCVAAMAERGAEALVEIGPGRVLCGMARRIAPYRPAFHAEDEASVGKAMEGLGAAMSTGAGRGEGGERRP